MQRPKVPLAQILLASETLADVDASTVRAGGAITLDAENRQINLEITAGELKRRRQAWRPPPPRYTRGVLAKYASTVTSASLGAVTDLNLRV